MLLPPQADLIVLAIAGCGLFGTLVYLIRGGRLFWVVVGGAIFTAVFVALFVMTLTMTCKVVRVRGGSHVYVERCVPPRLADARPRRRQAGHARDR